MSGVGRISDSEDSVASQSVSEDTEVPELALVNEDEAVSSEGKLFIV